MNNALEAALRHKLHLLCLMLLLVAGCVGAPPSKVVIQSVGGHVGAPVTIMHPTTLKVATFNVWGLPSWLTGASVERYPKIARELVDLGSDVVLLQEVWTRRSFDELSGRARRSGHPWWTTSARRKGTFLGQNGLLTLSRYPIESGAVYRFSTARLPDSLMTKGALKTTITIPSGDRINIWNVHLQDGATGDVQSCQIDELVHWIRRAEDGQIADIVGGDFNFTPGSSQFRRVNFLIGPSVHQLAATAPPPTWDELKPAAMDAQTLDHVFVRLRQQTMSIGASPRPIFTAASPSERLSDHTGVEATLTFLGLVEHEPAILTLYRATASR